MLLLIVNAIYKDNGRCTLSKRDMDMGCMMACIGEFQIRNIDGFSFVDSDRKGRGGQNGKKKKKNCVVIGVGTEDAHNTYTHPHRYLCNWSENEKH